MQLHWLWNTMNYEWLLYYVIIDCYIILLSYHMLFKLVSPSSWGHVYIGDFAGWVPRCWLHDPQGRYERELRWLTILQPMVCFARLALRSFAPKLHMENAQETSRIYTTHSTSFCIYGWYQCHQLYVCISLYSKQAFNGSRNVFEGSRFSGGLGELVSCMCSWQAAFADLSCCIYR